MALLEHIPLRGILSRAIAGGIRWRAPEDPRTPFEMHRSQSRQLAGILRGLRGSEAYTALALGPMEILTGRELTDAFREGAPLRRYGDLAPAIERIRRGGRDILFPGRPAALAQTSGTTSAEGSGERWIPQTDVLLGHHARGATTALARVLDATGPVALEGRLLMLGGSTALTRNDAGIPVGDLSGITVDRIPWFLEGLYEPGRKLALESIWSRKVERIAHRLADRHVSLVGGIPSWCLVLFEAVCQHRGVHRLRDAWPGLSAMVHGGVSVDT
ncbi:MAG TPA: GH3 auxin-responsive promoter family protein, partial [Fibrobacteria bacterium]|nr:GH3 auxin-responsive promoter family protein [Fibrobacteria bacterium]